MGNQSAKRVPEELKQPAAAGLNQVRQRLKEKGKSMAEVSVTFRSISRLKFHQIRARIRAQAEAMSYDENSGCAWDSWMEIQWLYEEGDQKLTITCTKRPIWRTEGWAESKIRGLVEAL